MNMIFKILSLLDSAENFLQICYRDFHLTLDVLLHYPAKSENQIYSCFKNNPFLFSYFSQTAVVCGAEDPTRVCVQPPPDHGLGRAAPACRGGMGPSEPGSD